MGSDIPKAPFNKKTQKEMKKNIFAYAAALLLLGLGACSEEREYMPQENGTVMMTVYANRGDAATRSDLSETAGGDLACAWTKGDQLLVTDAEGKNLGNLNIDPEDPATGKFTGSIILDIKSGKKTLHYFYLGSAAGNLDNVATGHTFDLSSQDGLIGSLGKYDALSAEAEVSVIDGKAFVNGELTLGRHFALGHFTLRFPEGVEMTDGTVTISGDNLYTQATLGLKDRDVTGKTAGTISVTGSNGDIFVNLIPGSGVTPTFKATVDGKDYEGSLTPGDINAGRYYRKAAGEGVPVEMKKIGGDVDHTKNPLLKWAEGNLQRSGTGASVTGTIASDYTETGSYYQFGRNYGYNSVSEAAYEFKAEGSDIPSSYGIYPGTGSTTSVKYYANKINFKDYPNCFFIGNNDSATKGDYVTPAFEDTWTERATKMGYTNETPCPKGWRLPTRAEYGEIMPIVNGKYGNTGDTAWKELVQFKTLADGTKCAFRWSKTIESGKSYLKIECLVVDKSTTETSAINWSDKNVQTRMFKGSGYIYAHRYMGTMNNSQQYVARPLLWGTISYAWQQINQYQAVVVMKQAASYMDYGGFYWTSDANQSVFGIIFNNSTSYTPGYKLLGFYDANAVNIRCVKDE